MRPQPTPQDIAADWYDSRAATVRSGALAVLFRANAAKVREGRADHRLPALLAEQAEFEPS